MNDFDDLIARARQESEAAPIPWDELRAVIDAGPRTGAGVAASRLRRAIVPAAVAAAAACIAVAVGVLGNDDSTGTTVARDPSTAATGRPPATAAPPSALGFPARQGSLGAPTFANPVTAQGSGPRIPPMAVVMVSCKVDPPSQVASAQPGGYWYRISSPPWGDVYYAAANTFWNEDEPGRPPYTSHVDPAIPDCRSGPFAD